MIIEWTLNSISTSTTSTKGWSVWKISHFPAMNVSLGSAGIGFRSVGGWLMDGFFLFQGLGKRPCWDPDSALTMVFDYGKRLFTHTSCACVSRKVLQASSSHTLFILWTVVFLHLVCWDLSKDFHDPPLSSPISLPSAYWEHSALIAKYFMCKLRLELGRNCSFYMKS